MPKLAWRVPLYCPVGAEALGGGELLHAPLGHSTTAWLLALPASCYGWWRSGPGEISALRLM